MCTVSTKEKLHLPKALTISETKDPISPIEKIDNFITKAELGATVAYKTLL